MDATRLDLKDAYRFFEWLHNYQGNLVFQNPDNPLEWVPIRTAWMITDREVGVCISIRGCDGNRYDAAKLRFAFKIDSDLKEVFTVHASLVAPPPGFVEVDNPEEWRGQPVENRTPTNEKTCGDCVHYLAIRKIQSPDRPDYWCIAYGWPISPEQPHPETCQEFKKCDPV